MKVKITCDSTVDLSEDLIKKYDIEIVPLIVSLGDNSYYDGIDIFSKDIFEYYDKTGILPKTAARSAAFYKDCFLKYTEKGYEVVHINLSNEMSASHNNARLAALELPGVYVVDSKSLSSGSGLLGIYAAELAKTEKYSGEQIYKAVLSRVDYVQASFIVGNLKFLHKGGRCSTVAMLGANLLKIKPSIVVENGKMRVDKKYMGLAQSAYYKYAKDTLAKFNNPDKKRIFITYTSTNPEILSAIKTAINESYQFEEIIETQAGATITGHCGKGTLGILYINDGGNVQI